MSSYRSRKSQPRQKSISSFFLPVSAPTPSPRAPPTTAKNPIVVSDNTTPEKVPKLFRPQSTFVQNTQGRSSFEEPASSDTSFVSPDVDNFRNPVLKSLVGKAAGSPTRLSSQNGSSTDLFVVSDSEDGKENVRPTTQEITPTFGPRPTLKRAATSSSFDLFKPKKLWRKSPAPSTPPPSSLTNTRVSLSEAQLEVIDAVVNRRENVFFTGSAGTGKSVVLRQLVGELYRLHGQSTVGVTASTGLAACNINGQTVHKFLGIGLGTGSPTDLANKIKKNPITKKKWTTLKVLLIDEISMIDGRLFTKIDEIAKLIMNKNTSFGGIQVVCSGDFFQLPPVDTEGKSQYCFDSPSWKTAMKHTMVLKKVFRQEGDNQLIDMLNSLREGTFSQESLRLIHSLKRKVEYTDGIEPTELFPTRIEVKRAKEFRLSQLQGDSFTFIAKDNDSSPQSKKLFENLMCEEKLTLKKGVQVMYLKNHPDNTVVNGSIGRVVAFLPESIFAGFFTLFSPIEFINPVPEFVQMVEILSDAIGQSSLSVDKRNVFESLSERRKQKLAPLISEAFGMSKDSGLMPVVVFKTNKESTLMLVRREEFSVDQGRNFRSNSSMPETLVREQVPLVLAWAMSIHKSQGQSIDRLRVDLRRTFEKGQIYVALSRATNKEQLEVYNFDHSRIIVSKEVQDFYKSLRVVGE